MVIPPESSKAILLLENTSRSHSAELDINVHFGAMSDGLSMNVSASSVIAFNLNCLIGMISLFHDENNSRNGAIGITGVFIRGA